MRNLPRVYTSFMPNAPKCNGVPGALLDVIKKCLIGGWTPFDISKIEVVSGEASIFFDYGTAELPDYCMLTISGCSEPLLNKEVQIIRGYNKRAVFKTTVADGVYGGPIKATPSDAGWKLLFSGTNVAVITQGNSDSTKSVVRLDDTKALTLHLKGGALATDVDTIIDSAEFSNDYSRIMKAWSAAAAKCMNWTIVCDNTTVYINTDGQTILYDTPLKVNYKGGRWYGFGDYLKTNATVVDPFFVMAGAFSESGNENYN